MTTTPARILALAVAALGCGAQLGWGQQFQQYAGPSPAQTGADQFQPGGMPGYQGAQQTTPYWQQTPPGAYFNQVNDGNYVDPYQVDSYGATPDGGCCPPQGCYIYTRAEVFVLTRNLASDRVYAEDAITGATLSNEDFDLEYEPGIRGVVGIPLSECHTLEAVYFGLHEWNETAALNSPSAAIFGAFNNFGFGPLFGLPYNFSTTQTISYSSELHNAELNMQRRFKTHTGKQEIFLLAGARYVNLEENFAYGADSPFTGGGFSTVDTDNHMAGFQLGGGVHHCIKSCLRFSADAKAALMVNWSEQISQLSFNNVTVLNEKIQDEDLAFVADGGVSLTWDICCWASVTGGYRVFYVDGAALATENFNSTLPAPFELRTTALDNDGSVLYHGATAGLEIRW